jgi:hypothetical protein
MFIKSQKKKTDSDAVKYITLVCHGLSINSAEDRAGARRRQPPARGRPTPATTNRLLTEPMRSMGVCVCDPKMGRI